MKKKEMEAVSVFGNGEGGMGYCVVSQKYRCRERAERSCKIVDFLNVA